MGQRAKAELLGIVELITDLYSGKNDEGKRHTINEIELRLRADGYDISREAIRKTVKTSKEVAGVYQKSLQEAKILIDTVRDNPNTDVVEVTASLLAHQLFSFAKSIDSLDFKDPFEFTLAVNKLSDAQTKIAKLRLDFQKGFEAAKKALIEELRKEMKKEPGLLDKLTAIITRVEPQK